jgi:hypothetical protein
MNHKPSEAKISLNKNPNTSSINNLSLRMTTKTAKTKGDDFVFVVNPYIFNKKHVHCFIFDNLNSINTGNPLCLACAWDINFNRKIKLNERISLKDLEVLITNPIKSVKFTIDVFYYLKFMCFLQPLCLENDFNGRLDDNSNNMSAISGRKTMLGIKDFSELLEKKKEVR